MCHFIIWMWISNLQLWKDSRCIWQLVCLYSSTNLHSSVPCWKDSSWGGQDRCGSTLALHSWNSSWWRSGHGCQQLVAAYSAQTHLSDLKCYQFYLHITLYDESVFFCTLNCHYITTNIPKLFTFKQSWRWSICMHCNSIKKGDKFKSALWFLDINILYHLHLLINRFCTRFCSFKTNFKKWNDAYAWANGNDVQLKCTFERYILFNLVPYNWIVVTFLSNPPHNPPNGGHIFVVMVCPWCLPEATARGHDDDVNVTGVWLLAMLEPEPVLMMMMMITGSDDSCGSVTLLSVQLLCAPLCLWVGLGPVRTAASDTKRESDSESAESGDRREMLAPAPTHSHSPRAQLTRVLWAHCTMGNL